MSEFAKLWSKQFVDDEGEVFGNCYAEFWDVTGAARKLVWLNRNKTLPVAGGTLDDIEGDAEGWITAYGDGLYRIKIRASGDDGSGAPIRIFEGVQLLDNDPAYQGDTADFALDEFEERTLSGQGRQGVSTAAQSTSTIDLSLFDVAGSTYLVPGASGTFQKVSVEDYTDGARITLECVTDTMRLRAKRAGEGSGYNLQIGTDFIMSVGSSIDLELRSGEWYERGRFFYDAAYVNQQYPGIASATNVIATGRAIRVTGSTEITRFYWVRSGESPAPGQRLDVHFTGTASVTDTGNIDLLSEFTAEAGATLSLIAVGTTTEAGVIWREISRSVGRAAKTMQTLGDTATPSVAADQPFWTTGSNTDPVQVLEDPGYLGRIITIYNGGDPIEDGPTGTYVTTRKYFEHAAVTTEGYLFLKWECDFGTTPGDTLTLQVQYDPVNDVLFWKEINRSMVYIKPKIPSGATLTWWRPQHQIYGGDSSPTAIMPIANGSADPLFVSFEHEAGGDHLFDDTGSNNYLVDGGDDDALTMNQSSELYTFMAVRFNNGVVFWQKVMTARGDVA